jgi:AcrR family transcriptional regulator
MSIKERHQREHKARREAILVAAARVFARQGLEGVTIEMVAREAEVAVGTIYLYFSSQDDLYLNLVVEQILQLRSRYIENPGAPPRPAGRGASYRRRLSRSSAQFA